MRLAILGLGQIGASFGLALAGQVTNVERVGYDPRAELSRQAQKIGAVDRISSSLSDAVKNAEIVVLALPIDEIREALQMIAPVLPERCVVLDTSPIKSANSQWANQILPGERFYITFTPALNPTYLEENSEAVNAHADLFKNSVITITTPPGIEPDAIRLTGDLTRLLGAQPLFIDPFESDGLMAASHWLPKLAAVALLNATIDQPGWREGQKLAGKAYAQATQPATSMDETKEFGQGAILNRENVLRALDNLIAALQSLRTAIEARDHQTLTSLIHHARQGRETWLKHRHAGDWESRPETEIPGSGEVFARMFGLRTGKKPK